MSLSISALCHQVGFTLSDSAPLLCRPPVALIPSAPSSPFLSQCFSLADHWETEYWSSAASLLTVAVGSYLIRQSARTTFAAVPSAPQLAGPTSQTFLLFSQYPPRPPSHPPHTSYTVSQQGSALQLYISQHVGPNPLVVLLGPSLCLFHQPGRLSDCSANQSASRAWAPVVPSASQSESRVPSAGPPAVSSVDCQSGSEWLGPIVCRMWVLRIEEATGLRLRALKFTHVFLNC